MHSHRVKVMVPKDHRLSVTLPENFPEGPAEVIVLSKTAPTQQIIKLAGVLAPGKAPSDDRDSIADALREFRREREQRFRSNMDSERDC